MITNLPAPIRDAIQIDQPNRSINDVAAEILSQRYQLPYRPSGRTRTKQFVTDSLLLKLPEPVWVALKKEATPYSTIRKVAIQAFADHYKVTL